MENSRFIIYKNTSIFYRVYGNGKAVILIHGFGEDGNIWSYLADNLKNNYLVIVPDLPGSGRSDILKDQNHQISIEDYAGIILHIFTSESLQYCTIIGHSMGGYIALAFAEKHPELLKGFGFFNSTAFADSEDKKISRLKSIEFLQKNDAVSFLKTTIPGLFADKFREEHLNEIENLSGSFKYFTSEALIQYCKAMINRPERINVLQTSNLPVLFIIGEKDPAIPLEKSLAQCHLPPVAYVYIIPGMGHMGMLEEKELCIKIVLAYLDNC